MSQTVSPAREDEEEQQQHDGVPTPSPLSITSGRLKLSWKSNAWKQMLDSSARVPPSLPSTLKMACRVVLFASVVVAWVALFVSFLSLNLQASMSVRTHVNKSS